MKRALSNIYPGFSGMLMLSVSLLLIAGCGKQKETSGQVVAKVNGTEISIYQLNSALLRSPGMTPQNAGEFRAKVLDKLIDQQLAVGKAQEKELDRTPEVIQSLEEAKRDILSRSYLDKIAATVTKPNDDEARAYYKAHPEMFADRHVYQIGELATPTGKAPTDSLLAMVTTQSPEEVEKWLKEKKIEYVASTGVRAAEQMSPAVLQEMRKLKVGQAAVVETGATTSILKLLSTLNAPVSEAVALPQIRRMLDNQKNFLAMTAELKQLREQAKIEITGVAGKSAVAAKFGSKAAPTANASQAPVSMTEPAPAPSPAPAIAPAAIATPETPRVGTPPAVNIEKGVAGLK